MIIGELNPRLGLSREGLGEDFIDRCSEDRLLLLCLWVSVSTVWRKCTNGCYCLL